MPSDVNLGVRRACSRSAGVSFSSAFKSRVIMQSLIRFVTFPYHYRPQTKCRSFADGSGGPGCALRTSPSGFGLTRTFRALPLAGAALPLTCRAAPANPSTFATLTTPGRLRSLRSASSLSFLVILLPQNNSLTFVRGADRACCAPHKRFWRPTFALPVLDAARPPEGHWRAHPAAAPCRWQRLLYYRYITVYIMTKKTANVKMPGKNFPNFPNSPNQQRKSRGQCPGVLLSPCANLRFISPERRFRRCIRRSGPQPSPASGPAHRSGQSAAAAPMRRL